jgi:hypothetical protein
VRWPQFPHFSTSPGEQVFLSLKPERSNSQVQPATAAAQTAAIQKKAFAVCDKVRFMKTEYPDHYDIAG